MSQPTWPTICVWNPIHYHRIQLYSDLLCITEYHINHNKEHCTHPSGANPSENEYDGVFVDPMLLPVRVIKQQCNEGYRV